MFIRNEMVMYDDFLSQNGFKLLVDVIKLLILKLLKFQFKNLSVYSLMQTL